ncbi:MAG TPA: glycosyltransferase family 39 protein [Solirubrobacteraceae bacterium]|nr:glycosyltransferase family 39 protein [Solirubrobacteraceae bacterium]
MLRSLFNHPRAPLVVLVVVSALSFLARAALLGEPCQNPCRQAGQHTLIFDEAYYVNAARVIAGIHPPVGSHYDDAPLGTDPNAEHPQLAKLIMAGAIELFGDGPFAWRIASLFFGSIAILGLFALVRAAGGGRWTAVGASTLMACDNLLLVHGRIGTLDIYVVAMMIWGVALYLRGRTLWAGLALAVAAAFKLVAPYALAVLVLIELARLISARRDPGAPTSWRAGPALRRLLICTFTASGVFMGLLGIMDLIATPYDDAARHLITGGPFDHFGHMVAYAAQQTSPNGPQGIASYPWWWFVDLRTIVYLRVNPSLPGQGLYAITPVCKFLGMVSPPILVLAVPALLFGGYRWWRRRRRDGGAVASGERQLAIVGPAWFLGTWVPFALQALIDQRTSYLYYMVIVMPGIYVAAAYLVGLVLRRPSRLARGVVGAWGLAVVIAVVLMYPFLPVF